MITAEITPDWTQRNDVRGCDRRGKAAELRLAKILSDMGFETAVSTEEENIKAHIDLWVRGKDGWQAWQIKSFSNDPQMPEEIKSLRYSFEWYLQDDPKLEQDWEFPKKFAVAENLLWQDRVIGSAREPAKPGWGMLGKSKRIAFERPNGKFEVMQFAQLQEKALEVTTFRFSPKTKAYFNKHVYQRCWEYKNRVGQMYEGWSGISYLHHEDISSLIERTL